MFKSIIAIAVLAIVCGVHADAGDFYGDTIIYGVPQAVSYQQVVPILPRPVYLRPRVNPGIGASLGGAIITPLGSIGAGVRAGLGLGPYGASAGISAGIGIRGPALGRGRIIG